MKKEAVTFVVTKYKNQKTKVNFYTKGGKHVSFDSVERVPRKQKVSFQARVK